MTIPYDRSRINDSSYNVEERRAAIYDYVGEVYSENETAQGKIKDFDGTLSYEERQATVAEFGELTDLKDTKGYLRNAAQKFLERHKAPEAIRGETEGCSDRLSQTEMSHPDYGEAFILGGNHRCGIQFYEMFQGYELDIAANPEDWTFFIESTWSKIALQDPNEEIALFTKMARALGIALYDPIVGAFSSEVVEEAKSREFGLTDLQIATEITWAIIMSYTDPEDTQDETQRIAFMKRVVEYYANMFGVSSRALEQSMETYVTPPPGGAENFHREISDKAAERYEGLQEINNALNLKRTQKIVEEEGKNGRRKYFFQTGDFHTIVGKTIFTP